MRIVSASLLSGLAALGIMAAPVLAAPAPHAAPARTEKATKVVKQQKMEKKADSRMK